MVQKDKKGKENVKNRLMVKKVKVKKTQTNTKRVLKTKLKNEILQISLEYVSPIF